MPEGESSRKEFMLSRFYTGLALLCFFSFLCSAQLKAKEERRATGLRVWETDEFWRVLPTLYSIDEAKLGLALDVTYINQKGFKDDRYSLTGTRLKLDDPNDDHKFRLLQFQTERRFYVRNRLYWGVGAGLLLFSPRPSWKEFYAARGQEFDEEIEPFGRIFIGWQVGRIRVGRRHYPLVLQLGYTKANPFKFPSPLADGTGEINPSGTNYGMSLRFRY
mgnify:FL=1